MHHHLVRCLTKYTATFLNCQHEYLIYFKSSYKILRHKHFDMQFFGLKYERDCISTFLRNRLQLQIGGYYVVKL
ncbi:TPA: hypothetical protein I2T51_09325 [Staphylococcus aureus]|nr:hypothetical protein [Staphylococcus aureus]